MARKKKKGSPDEVRLEPISIKKPGLLAWLRSRFFTGVVIAAPIAITISVTYWLITVVDNRIKPLLPPQLNIENYTQFAVPGFGVLVAVVALTLLGAVATNLIGRSFLKAGDRLINSVPYVRSLYKALKQIFETFGNSGNNSFKEVALIEYPKRGTWCIGFVAADAKGEVNQKLGEVDETYVGVFVPTTPNPTSGFLMYVKREELIPLSMTVEDGAKMIISGGLVSPEMPQAKQGNSKPDPEIPAAPGQTIEGEAIEKTGT